MNIKCKILGHRYRLNHILNNRMSHIKCVKCGYEKNMKRLMIPLPLKKPLQIEK